MFRITLAVLVFLAPAFLVVAQEPPEFVDYGGADGEARKAIALGWTRRNQPKRPPRPPVNPDGTVNRVDYEPHVAAMRKWKEDLREHFAALGKRSLAFLNEYPGSEHEAEMVTATLNAQQRAEEWDLLIRTSKRLRERYGKRFEMKCLSAEGDAWSGLQRFDRAAAAYRKYHEAAKHDARKSRRAASKHVRALIRLGRYEEAREAAEVYAERMPATAAHLRRMLSNVAIVGKPLPPTPGARFLLSDTEVSWRKRRDHPTVILLWTTQYVEDEEAMRDLAAMRKRLRDASFHALPVAFEERTWAAEESIDMWMKINGIADIKLVFERGRVSQSAILNAWGLSSREDQIALPLPFTIILDRKGVVRFAGCPVGPHLERQIRLAAKID